MKKLLVVFTAILVVAFAAPAFATDATWSGEFDFGGITAFDEAEITNGWANLYADVTLDVDEYTEVLIEFAGGFNNFDTLLATAADPVPSPTGNAWGVGYAGMTTDLGMALGLPVGLKMTGGYVNIYSEKYEVTGHATERVDIRSNIGTSPMFIAAVDVAPVTIKIGVGFEQGPLAQDYAVYAYAPGIADMVDIEAGYFIANNDDFKGNFMVTAKATDIMDMIGVAGGFRYNAAADGGVGDEQWFWGLGVKADLMDMLGIGVGVKGQEEDAFQILTVDVNVAVTDEFGADVGVGLGFGDVMETFGGLEASVYYTAGAGTWRLGYLYRNEDAAANNYMYAAPAAVPAPSDSGSGLFLNCGLDF